jgi:hypothetical protein
MRVAEENRLSSGVSAAVVRQSLEEHIAYLIEQIKQTELLIRNHIDNHPDLKEQSELLDSIPGIGEATAALLLAEIVNIKQYTNARQVAAYAGLVPRERRSGSSVRGRVCLSKIGNARLRKALYFPAITALRSSDFFKAWAEPLRTRGKSKMSVIGAAMRKLIHLAYGVIKTGKELKSLVHAKTADTDVSVYSVVFSRDGKSVLAGNGDGTISEWEIAMGREARVWKAHGDGVFHLIFSSDYRLLVSSGYGDYTTKIWDTATWREIRPLTDKKTEGLTEQIIAVAFTPNGQLIAASEVGFDEKLQDYAYSRVSLWNAATGEKLFSLQDSKFPMNAVIFTPDNRFVVTGSNDGNIIFWDVKTGKQTRTITNALVSKDE